jgi:hypothetical protein
LRDWRQTLSIIKNHKRLDFEEAWKLIQDEDDSRVMAKKKRINWNPKDYEIKPELFKTMQIEYPEELKENETND